MDSKEIFELIKDSTTSFGEARRIASGLAELPEEKQQAKIDKINGKDEISDSYK